MAFRISTHSTFIKFSLAQASAEGVLREEGGGGGGGGGGGFYRSRDSDDMQHLFSIRGNAPVALGWKGRLPTIHDLRNIPDLGVMAAVSSRHPDLPHHDNYYYYYYYYFYYYYYCYY